MLHNFEKSYMIYIFELNKQARNLVSNLCCVKLPEFLSALPANGLSIRKKGIKQKAGMNRPFLMIILFFMHL